MLTVSPPYQSLYFIFYRWWLRFKCRMGYPLTIRNQTEQIERAYRVVWFGKGTISVPFFFDLANVSTSHSNLTKKTLTHTGSFRASGEAIRSQALTNRRWQIEPECRLKVRSNHYYGGVSRSPLNGKCKGKREYFCDLNLPKHAYRIRCLQKRHNPMKLKGKHFHSRSQN